MVGDVWMFVFDLYYFFEQVKMFFFDVFEGCGLVIVGEKCIVVYVISQMKVVGLQLVGVFKDGKCSWIQLVLLGCFEIIGIFSFLLSMDGKSELLIQGDQIVVCVVQDGFMSVDIVNVLLVFVGYGVKVFEWYWDDFKGVDLYGKIVVVLINDLDFEIGQGDFGGKVMIYYGCWIYKYEEIVCQGVFGLLIIYEMVLVLYGWVMVKNFNINIQFDIVCEYLVEVYVKVEGWI